MIENFRLKNSTNKNFETNKDFLQRFGQISTLTNRKTDLPVTPLFASRTENETNRFNEIRREFRDDVVQILLNSFQTTSKDEQSAEIENINENLLPVFHSEFSIESSRSNSLQLPIRIESEEKSSSIEKSKIVRSNEKKIDSNVFRSILVDQKNASIDQSFVLVEVKHDRSKCLNDRRSTLFYEKNPSDSTTFSIDVEQNEKFYFY